MDSPLLRAACLELVTVNGRPFQVINNSEFRKVLNPLLQALSNSRTKACINAENTRDEIGTLAGKLRKETQKEVCGKLISLKIDIEHD